MNKTVMKVFILIGILVVIFLAWTLIFNEGGILRTGYNAMAEGINGQWEKVAGDGQTILPLWAADGETNGQGFVMDTE